MANNLNRKEHTERKERSGFLLSGYGVETGYEGVVSGRKPAAPEWTHDSSRELLFCPMQLFQLDAPLQQVKVRVAGDERGIHTVGQRCGEGICI